jgi:hypothetical protein
VISTFNGGSKARFVPAQLPTYQAALSACNGAFLNLRELATAEVTTSTIDRNISKDLPRRGVFIRFYSFFVF